MAVVSFKDLMGVTVTDAPAHVREFTIYNSNHWTNQNGGCNLYWCVPGGTQWIQFEVLSGGGPGGSSGGDHDIPVGGQGGNYAMKQLFHSRGDFVNTSGSGSIYCLCSGGTSNCSCCCHCCTACRDGCPSYVNGPTLSNFCAIGGRGGPNSWDVMSSCYNCQQHAQCNIGNYNAGWTQSTTYPGFCGFAEGPSCCRYAGTGTPTATGTVQGYTGTSGDLHQATSCCQEAFTIAGTPSGPYSTSSGMSSDWCTTSYPCCAAHSNFPGGGGTGSARATSSACWGFWGAGGLVKVKYQ